MGKATREAYGNALARIGKENTNIIVLDADLSKSTKTDTFKGTCPDRFFNVGIAEQNLISVGAGLAAAGKIPFVSSFSMFATGRAFEQIRNAVCYPKLNVKVCATHAGITVGEDGATHQSLEDISCMRTLPNMTVVVPADERETEAVIDWAASYEGPVYVRLGRAGVDDVTAEGYTFVPGKSTTLVEGSDVTIIACGALVGPAVEAAKLLGESNVSARVINMASIKPIDADAIIKAAAETGAIVTAEEHNIIGGLGSAVSEVVVANKPVPMEFVGVQDTFGESGTPKELMAKYGLQAYEVATFYNMYDLEPVGKYKLTVCTNLPCALRGGMATGEYLKQKLGIGYGETTPDGKFTLVEGECMGACGDAPVMLVNNHSMCSFMTEEAIDKKLAELK